MKLNVLSVLSYISKMPFSYYAVAKGRKPGVYLTWPDCQRQVNKYQGSVYKKFSSQAEAEDFIYKHSLKAPLKKEKTRFPYVECNAKKSCKCSSTLTLPSVQSRSELGTNQVFERNYSSRSLNLPEDTSDYVDVYTDGACSSNGFAGARAGIGVYFPDSCYSYLNVSRPVIGRATNNMAEIQAVTVAGKQAKRSGITKLKIHTDSKFVINCVTKWMPKWKRNGWLTASKEPVINKEELLEMERELAPLQIKWNHVFGHAGIDGNEMADKFAREGLKHYK